MVTKLVCVYVPGVVPAGCTDSFRAPHTSGRGCSYHPRGVSDTHLEPHSVDRMMVMVALGAQQGGFLDHCLLRSMALSH